MIKSVTVINHFGESLKLKLTRPEQSGFLIKNIDGLGPGKATVNTTKVATSDGARFNSAFSDQRDITLSLLFIETDTESIEDLRHKTYKYFPKKYEVELVIETDKRTSKIKGIVESNEPEIFSSAEGCVITITCPDPFFYSMTQSEVVFYGVEPMFEFPLENPSLDEPLIEMGCITMKQREVVYYDGDGEVGINITMHAIGDVTNITIYSINTRETITINTDRVSAITGAPISEGDTIFIKTSVGDKGITLLRDGIYYNILNSLGRNPKWFTITKGDNIFAYTAETGSNNLQFRVTYNTAYDGV